MQRPGVKHTANSVVGRQTSVKWVKSSVLSKVTQNESDTRRGPRAPRLQTDESAVKVLRRRPGGRETKRVAVEVGGEGVGRHTHRRMD